MLEDITKKVYITQDFINKLLVLLKLLGFFLCLIDFLLDHVNLIFEFSDFPLLVFGLFSLFVGLEFLIFGSSLEISYEFLYGFAVRVEICFPSVKGFLFVYNKVLKLRSFLLLARNTHFREKNLPFLHEKISAIFLLF